MIERVFIDWAQPFLPRVAEEMLERAGATRDGDRANAAGFVDLSEHLVLIPGARAGRLLLHALVQAANVGGASLLPPRIITPGNLLEALCAGNPLATGAECVLAWAAALRAASDLDLAPITPHRPRPDDHGAWLDMARMLQALDEELSGADVEIDSVAHIVEELGLEVEVERWNAIAHVREAARKHIHAAGLVEPTDSLREATSDILDATVHNVALVGLTELPVVHARAIQSMVEHRASVVSFISAPSSLAERFDDLGCLVPEAWAECTVDLPDESIRVVDRPADQVQAALRSIASYEGEFSAEEIAVGLGDESLAAGMERGAERVGLSLHVATGESMAASRPAIVLAAAADWLGERSFRNLAALARVVDIERALAKRPCYAASADWLSFLDAYSSRHLRARLDDEWGGAGENEQRLNSLRESVDALLSPLSASREWRAIASWMEGIIEFMQNIYGEFDLDRESESDRRLEEACRAVVEIAGEIHRIPPQLQFACDAAGAVRYLVAELSAKDQPQPIRAGQIEALGWLELRIDPARAVIITGINEGAIPASMTGDPFLPDSLRARLGLRDNRSRYARDLYVLESLIRSRERLTVICGRRSEEGESLSPSRLLLACDTDDLPERVLRLSSDERAESWALPLGAAPPAATSGFRRPAPPPGPIDISRIRVTQFKEYLTCPYRFWLKCLRGLGECADDADELDPLSFGGLAHEVLHRFGCDESMRESTDAESIATYLRAELDGVVRERFGRSALPAVRVQAARLRQRLDSFARLQARLRNEGWRISACELKLPEHASIDVEGGPPQRITGKIDRIDLHDDLGARLIDYKTSENGDGPRQTHGPKRDGSWDDLQLPLYHDLYRRFVNTSHPVERIRLAYIALPKKSEDVNLLEAEWNANELESALACARDVVRKIRAGKFEMSPEVPAEHDPFARICQTTGFGEEEQGE